MKYKVGDVVWAQGHGRVCIEEVINDNICKIIFLRNTPAIQRNMLVMQSLIIETQDIEDYLPICRVCEKTVPLENGMMKAHGDPLCYGSFIPQR